MSNTTKHIELGIENSYSYDAYEQLIADLLKEGKSTTKDVGNDAEMFAHYSELGLQRMQRWDKRFKLTEEQLQEIQSWNKKQIWLVLSEGWCGDAAHSLPIINKIAEANGQIELRVVLREENLDLMNEFLTDGGKSIPKLIMYNPETQSVEGTWGPRPKPAQEIFLEARANNVSFETYELDLQAWYNKDKGQTATQEILALMK